jgi:hypothetical protein
MKVFKKDGELIVRKYAKHQDPRTPVQVAAREKFGRRSKRLAQAWARLTPAEKDRCRRLALKKKLATGFMAFTQVWWTKGGKPGALKVRAPRMGRQLALKMKPGKR